MEDERNIEINNDVRFGKPCIKGMRISVDDVLGWLANGMSEEEMLSDFPEITLDDIQACVAYKSQS